MTCFHISKDTSAHSIVMVKTVTVSGEGAVEQQCSLGRADRLQIP